MRKIIVTEFVTLDGIIEDPGGSEKTKYGGWSFDYYDNDIGKFKLKELMDADALLLGRVTYEGFAASWPSMRDDAGFADKMNSMRKYVVSTKLKNPSWQNSTIITGNITKEVTGLKKEKGKDILVAGSGTLASALSEWGLVDEYNLLVYPTALGRGKRFLRNGIREIKVKPLEQRFFKTGAILFRYSAR